MKSFEIEERIREEGIAEGIEKGKAVGHAEGLAEGKTVGLAEGITQGKINDILDLLNDLGEIPISLEEQITAQKDEEILRAWLRLAAKAESIEDFTKQI